MSPVAKRGDTVFAQSVCLWVCWFVGWTTLTLVMTFEPFEMEPLYLTSRFLMTRASHSYKKFLPLTLICDLLKEKRKKLVITFEPFQIESSYLACSFLMTRAFH